MLGLPILWAIYLRRTWRRWRGRHGVVVGRRWRRPRQIHSRRRRCCRRERRQGLKRSSRLHCLLVLGCLVPSNALSTEYVGCRFLPPVGKETNVVSGVEHACRKQPFRNLTSVTMYSPKPRPHRALKWFEPRPNRTLLMQYFQTPPMGRCSACFWIIRTPPE